jgi:glutamate-5-semialdehyde dehydrogenase
MTAHAPAQPPGDLAAQMAAVGRAARAASVALRETTADQRTAALHAIAAAVRASADDVLGANALDLAAARANSAPAPLLDRLALDAARMEGVAKGVEAVAAQPDPVGAEIARWTRPNGLDIARVRTPIGVIGVIYESRPNVGVDAAAIAVRSGNAVILRGGSDSLRSALALQAAVEGALRRSGLPEATVQMAATADRDAVGLMLAGLDGAIDLLIPRGGKSLVRRVREEARVAVLGHLEGLNTTYVHAAADAAKARAIVLDAKMRRTSVCGATETLLIDRAVAAALLPEIGRDLEARGCELRADAEAGALLPHARPAQAADWRTEHLAPILNVGVVEGLEAAVAHIAAFGSGHTDAIVTEDEAAAAAFTARVDSAIVLVNASTQFADGGEFGFGAEIGIATDRLHARGPVGPEQLTTFKYVVRGTGQVRG